VRWRAGLLSRGCGSWAFARINGSIAKRCSDGRLYKNATVIDADGRLRAKHRKVHLFDVDVPSGIRSANPTASRVATS
jgi:omega-amidase